MALESEIQTVELTGNIYIDSLLYDYGYQPGTVITYVFQSQDGDPSANGGSLWSSNGRRAGFNQALQTWSAVANIIFQESPVAYDGTGDASIYDWVETMDTLVTTDIALHDLPSAGTITGTYNLDTGYFVSGSTSKGGIGYATFVHEIGHGLGLLHPFNDPGDPVGDPAFPGVTAEYDYGDNDLNQGVFTAMSYLGGYWQVGLSPSASFGWEMGPGAFDIAAAQHIYGANMATASGASSYTLPGVNAAGTGWLCLWDAGGTDTITAGSSGLDAIIDLRAATLINAPGGGGFVSRITGVLGGFTIASGVTIENATGGSGDDWFHGNAANNVITGGAGFDTIDYSGVTAALTINLAAGTATGDGADTLNGIENARGGSGNDTLTAIAGINVVRDALDLTKPGGVAATQQTAIDLDYRFSAHAGDPAVQAGAGQSTVTIHGTNTGGGDWYSFYLASTGSILIDIDNTFAIDSIVTVFAENGVILGSNDDSISQFALDGGSANDYDSYLSLASVPGGQRIFVRVTTFGGDPGTYDLNVSAATTRTASGTVLVGSMLDGGAGNDTLVGGAGLDTLIGGTGDDSFVINQQGDVVVEGDGEGTDTVTASGNFYLYANIENLVQAAGA
ncbi:peptidase M10/serralysin-like protein, partial [Novosphingobium kunmingense]